MVSDSSSADVLKGSSESLVGRINPYIMLSMKFIDVIRYYETKNKKLEPFDKINWDLRQAFTEAVKKSNPKLFYNQIKDTYTILVPYEDKLKIYLQTYLLKDGYPELLDLENLHSCAERIRNYLNLTLYNIERIV